MFLTIDRTSKVAFAELHPRATKLIAADFLRCVLENLPYKVHKVLTDNGTQFGNMPHQPQAGRHVFDHICQQYGIEIALPSPHIPGRMASRVAGAIERMNRTIKEATVQRYHYQTMAELNHYLQTFC